MELLNLAARDNIGRHKPGHLLAFVSLADRPAELRRLGVLPPLAVGALFMPVQAIGMCFPSRVFLLPLR
jgi:hypothetical protein